MLTKPWTSAWKTLLARQRRSDRELLYQQRERRAAQETDRNRTREEQVDATPAFRYRIGETHEVVDNRAGCGERPAVGGRARPGTEEDFVEARGNVVPVPLPPGGPAPRMADGHVDLSGVWFSGPTGKANAWSVVPDEPLKEDPMPFQP